MLKHNMEIASASKGKLDTGAAIRLHYQSNAVITAGIKRGTVVTMTVSGKKVRRIALLTPNLVAKESIAFDYNTRLELGIAKQATHAVFTIQPSSQFGVLMFVWNHPDASIRIGARCAVWLTGLAVGIGEVLNLAHHYFL